MSLRGLPPSPLSGQVVGPQRGDVVRCNGCGCVFPLVEIRGLGLVPCVPYLALAGEPMRNLLGPDGKPAPVTDVLAFVRSTTCAPRTVFVPHAAVCPQLAALAGEHVPLFIALAGPPPPCATCGGEWVDHQREGCACPKWVAPPPPTEPEPAPPEGDGV